MASSSAVAASRGVRLQRRSASTMNAPPSTTTNTGIAHTMMPSPEFDGVEQHAVAPDAARRRRGSRRRTGLPGSAPGCRRESGATPSALLSATDCPSHTGHASWCSSRAARARRRVVGRERTTRTTIAATTTTASAIHGACFFICRWRPLRTPSSQVFSADSDDGPERSARRDAVGRDDIRLRLPVVPKPSAALPLGSSATG